MLAPSQFQLAALGWHQQLTTLVRTQFLCGHAAVLPHGGLEPTLTDAAVRTKDRSQETAQQPSNEHNLARFLLLLRLDNSDWSAVR